MAISGNTAIIGAPGDDDSKGSAYVFAMNIAIGDWEEFSKLTASDAVQDNRFGSSVAISGNTAIIGARCSDDDSKGSAYVFAMDSTGSWEERVKLTNDAVQFENFCYSVGISGNTAIIGPPHDKENGESSGSAYVFSSFSI